MTWGSFFVKTLGMIVVMYLLFFYGYADYVLIDSVVPIEGMEIEEWLVGYKTAGAASAAVALLCSAIWFAIGDSYSGGSGIGVKFYGLLLVSVLLGIAVNVFMVPDSIDGSGLAAVYVVLYPAVVYYLSALFAYAAPVKYIPAGSESIHK